MITKSAPWSLAITGALLIGLLLPACRRQQRDTGASPAVVEAVNHGVSLMGQYDYDGAAKAFEQALATAPDLPEVQVNLAIARFNRGRKENQDIEQATQLLDTVIRQHPDNLRAWYFKSIVLQHLGQAEAAVPCLEKVLRERPDDGVAWYLLGMCKQRLGRDARTELQRAIELRPYLTSAYYKLWQTLQAAGEPAKAGPYLEKFKQLREHPLAETVELPQYNQMGDLALVVPIGGPGRPSSTSTATYRAGTATPVVVHSPTAAPFPPTQTPASPVFGGAALMESDGEGHLVALLSSWLPPAGKPEFQVRLPSPGAPPAPAASGAGLEAVMAPQSCVIGDYDNDGMPDLFVVGEQSNALFHGAPGGGFTRVPGAFDHPAGGGRTRSALWLDADHDGDLDLLLCNTGAASQLFNNQNDGTFVDIAVTAGLARPGGDVVMALPGDLDGDRDMDLVLLRANAPALVLLNELSGQFRELPLEQTDIRGEFGGVLQDFNGDGILDLVVLGGEPVELKLFLGAGHARFQPGVSFAGRVGSGNPAEALRGFRVADVDLDGDLDIAVFGREGYLLLNDGAGKFGPPTRVWAASPGSEIAGAELTDLTGDLVPDLLLLERGATNRVSLVPGALSPASSAVSLAPTGIRSRDKRTRSPASGYGAALTVRARWHEQSQLFTGQNGGFNQSPRPVVFGLGGAPAADYARLLWSDGVAQVENTLTAGRTHAVAETQRKISSCPILFTWNGSRFEFITDFAGVGGLGYLAAPGEYATPQPVDHVKIEPQQLQARDGRYELRITEAMEETAYVDRLELLAIDHPRDWVVYPDERLAVTGPAPSHELLVIRRPIYPQRAKNPAGADCADALQRADRHYAFEPELDRRFFGFCRPHTLELEFGDQLASLRPGEKVFLFINGYLEYPYSQTAYAASQAGVLWDPIRIERRRANGQWEAIVPDAGALGGMARTMTVDLTGLVGGGACQLRLTSNLEIYYDQIFLGVPAARSEVKVHALPVAEAELRYSGFAREVSPDGRLPLVYDYQQSEPTAPFHVLRGAYTRYGPVRELLEQFDDQYVLVGPGDEIAAKFDATRLPPLADGETRSFVLVSHAYCKDMDLYTATPQTVEPLPFRGMSRYPYPATEHYPETPEHRRYRATYNTRIVE